MGSLSHLAKIQGFLLQIPFIALLTETEPPPHHVDGLFLTHLGWITSSSMEGVCKLDLDRAAPVNVNTRQHAPLCAEASS